jgi:hypothetical protein
MQLKARVPFALLTVNITGRMLGRYNIANVTEHGTDTRALVLSRQAEEFTSAEWQVLFPKSGQWSPLPLEASQRIESNYTAGASECIYTQCKSKKQDKLHTYKIEFATMQQRNLDTGRYRSVRREVKARTAAEHSPNDINHSFQSDSVPDDASSEVQREGVWREPSPDATTEQDLSNLQYENAPASSSNSTEKLQKRGTKISRRYS